MGVRGKEEIDGEGGRVQDPKSEGPYLVSTGVKRSPDCLWQVA